MQTNSEAKWGPEDKCIASAAPWIRSGDNKLLVQMAGEGSIQCGRDRHVPAVDSRHTHFSCSLGEYMYVFACGRTSNSATRGGACKAFDCVSIWNIDKGLFQAHMQRVSSIYALTTSLSLNCDCFKLAITISHCGNYELASVNLPKTKVACGVCNQVGGRGNAGTGGCISYLDLAARNHRYVLWATPGSNTTCCQDNDSTYCSLQLASCIGNLHSSKLKWLETWLIVNFSITKAK